MGNSIGFHAGTWSPWFVNMLSPARWAIVAAYLCVAWQCLCATRRNDTLPRLERKAWRLIALVMLLLAITRLIDWPAVLLDVARHYAVRQGWYAMRAVFQTGAIGLIVLLAVVGVAVLRKQACVLPRAALISLGGLIVLLAFCAARAVSLHAVDVFFGLSIAGVRLHWMIEVAGILAIAIGARAYRRAGNRV